MLGCAFATATNAQSIGSLRIDKFPTFVENAGEESAAKAPSKVVNDDKPLGSKMWAVNNHPVDRDPGFVYFYEKNTTQLNKTGIILPYEEDDLRRMNIASSTYHNGKYIGYMYYRWDMGINELKNFVEIDLENGTWKSLQDMSSLSWEWNYMEALTSNPKTGKLIGLGRDKGDVASSGIFEINPETGEYNLLHDLKEYYYTIAYDREGTLWAVRWKYNAENKIIGTLIMTLDENNGYAETNVKEIKSDGNPVIFYGQSQNSMYFHPKTGKLFMLAQKLVNESTIKQYLCNINTENGAMENAILFGWAGDDSATGLYIPGTLPDTTDSANKVTDITSTYDENGVITISWTNPTLNYNNTELTELAEVLVYRDGEADENLVATIKENVSIGGKMSWTDTKATAGLHEYFIVPCRIANEKGVSDSWKAFSGKDVAGQPTDIKLEKLEKTSLKISWNAAENGANDGWYDKANVTYKVVRHPDNITVAEGIKETTFTDNTIDLMNQYSYTVFGVTAEGNGTEVTTETILAGNAYDTPYHTDFQTEAEAMQWTILDNNKDGSSFSYLCWGQPYGMSIACWGSDDDYVISPDIKLSAGKAYKVKMNIYINWPATDYNPEFGNSFRMTAGQGLTAADQKIELYSATNFQTFKTGEVVLIEGVLTPDVDGNWNVAFHSNNVKENFMQDYRLCGVTVYEILDYDLTATAIAGTTNPSHGVASQYTVSVKNIGQNTISDYKVQVVRIDGDEQVVLGETSVSEALEPEKTTEISLEATPDMEGTFNIAGKVILESDLDNSNNTTEPYEVEASPEGTVPFNTIVTGEAETGNTRIGISFMKFHSHMQHYYHPEDFGEYITPGEKINIHRIALEYNSNDAVTEPFELTIFLGNTEVASVDNDTKAWLPTSELTQVYYNDALTTLPGNNNLLIFDLDTPFEYNTANNMVMAFVKNGLCSANEFPAIWRTFNENWDNPLRTLRFESGTEDEPIAGESGNCLPNLPYLHLAISKGGSSIEDITIGGSNNIEYANGVLSFNGIDAASVEIYDIAGRTIANQAFNSNQINVALENGIYVVKVTDCNGKVYTQKISAKN